MSVGTPCESRDEEIAGPPSSAIPRKLRHSYGTGALVLKLLLWIVVGIFALIGFVVAANYIYSNGRQNGFCDALETLVEAGRISPADACTAEDRPPRLPFLIGP